MQKNQENLRKKEILKRPNILCNSLFYSFQFYREKAIKVLDSLISQDKNKYNIEIYNKKKLEYNEKLQELDRKTKKVAVPEGGDKDKEENKDDPFAKLKEQLSGCLVSEA